MHKRFFGALFALLLFVAACGSPDDEGQAVVAEQTPTPAADETASPETPEPEPDAEEPPDPDDTDERQQPAAADPEPEPESDPEPTVDDYPGVNRPVAGQYVYDLSGTRDTPFDAVPHKYSDDARVDIDLHRDGDTYTSESRSTEDDTETTNRIRWTGDEVLLEYMKITIPNLASFECTLDPPVTTLRFPLEPGAYPDQAWSGDDCSGEASIEVIGEEEITDAAGRTWQAWRIESETTYQFGESLSGETESTTWFAPDLGTAVKSDTENDGSFNESSFSTHQITLLREHP